MSYASELYINFKKSVGIVRSVDEFCRGEYPYKWGDWETGEKCKCYFFWMYFFSGF